MYGEENYFYPQLVKTAHCTALLTAACQQCCDIVIQIRLDFAPDVCELKTPKHKQN